MSDLDTATPEQIERLYDAAFALAGSIAADACRLVAEGDDDMLIGQYLNNLTVKTVREFDEAVAAIQHTAMEGYTHDSELVRKYEAAMAEMRRG